MAMHTVIVPSATVISCYVAAEVAFVLNIGFFVLLTVGYSKFVVRLLPKKFALRTLLLLLLHPKVKHTGINTEGVYSLHIIVLLLLQSAHIFVVATGF
jgi:hypothetical protein